MISSAQGTRNGRTRCIRKYSKARKARRDERLGVLARNFPDIALHIGKRPEKVGIDDLLDAAAAAWSALRIWEGTAESVCDPGRDDRGLRMSIQY